MSDALKLRRLLYERLAAQRRIRDRLRPNRRAEARTMRRAVAYLAARREDGPDDGSAGVREPRRPLPPQGPAAAARPYPTTD